MANDNTSLEGVDKPFGESVKYQFWRIASWIGNLYEAGKDTVVDTIKEAPELLQDTKQIASDTFDRVVTFWDKLISWEIDFIKSPFEQQVDTSKVSFSENERVLWKKMNDLGGWQMTKDIFNIWKSFLPQFLVWDELSKNLVSGLNKKDFETQLDQFNTQKQNAIKKQQEILLQEKYKDILDFNNKIREEYLKLKWITEIEDQNDFSIFQESQFKKLSSVQQRSLMQLEQDISKEIWAYSWELEELDLKTKEYINTNMYWWYEKFEEINKKQEDNFKWNETIEIQKQIYWLATEKIDNDLKWLSNIKKSADVLWFNNFKDSVIDDIATDYNYELWLLWAKNIPWNEELAKKAREINKVSYKLNLNILNNYLEAKTLPENKWLSEVDLKNKVLKQTYIWLSNEEKDILRSKEALVTAVSQLKEKQSAWDKLANFNPLWLLNAISYWSVTLQRVLDQAYDINEEVPHYIRQETRNLIYSNENLKDKITSSLTYNTDWLLSLLWWGWIAKATKIPKWAERFWKLLEKWITKLKLPIAWKYGTAKLVWNSVANITASQIYWAAADPVIDNLMVEAPTKTIEQFNYISNLLFDMWSVVIWRWIKTSANAVSYKFLNWEVKEAIKEAQKVFEAKWLKLTEQETKEFLEEWVNWLYQTVYNPKEFAESLNKKWEVYKLISDHVNTMDKNKITWLLTEWWFGLKKDYDKIMWIPQEYINNLKENTIRFTQETNELKKQILARNVDNILSWYEKALNVTSDPKATLWWIGWNVIDIKYKNDPEFLKMWREIKEDLALLKETFKKWENFKYKTDLNYDTISQAIDNLNNKLSIAQRKFWIKKYNDSITLITPNKKEITIKYNELSELEQKDFNDMVSEWRITIRHKWELYENARIKTRKFDIIDNKVDDIIRNYIPAIKEYIQKYDNWTQNFTENTIRNKLKTLITKWWITSLEFLATDKLFNQSALDDFAELAQSVVKDMVWSDHMLLPPIHINDLESTITAQNKHLWLASWDLVLDELKKKETNLLLAYWSFYLNDGLLKEWKKSNAFYLTFWKWILDKPNIYEAINASVVDVSNKWSMWKFINKVSDIRKQMFDFSYNWKTFNLTQWIEDINTVYSSIHPSGLFKDWNLNKKTLDSLIKKLIWTKQNTEEVQNFVYDLFKDANESEIIEPMIHNIIYKYSQHSELINKMMENLDNESFKKIFSEILLKEDLAKAISERIIKTNKDETREVFNSKLLEQTKSKWQDYLKQLEFKKANYELEKKKINQYIEENIWVFDNMPGLKISLDKKINDIDWNIEHIDKIIKSENSIDEINKLMNSYTDKMTSYFKWEADKFASLNTIFKKYSKLFAEKKTSLKDRIDQISKTTKTVNSLSTQNKEKLKIFLDKIVDTDFFKIKTEETELILKEIEDAWDELKPIMKEIFDAKFDDITKWTVYIEDAMDVLKWYSKTGYVLDYDEVMKKNPYETYINWFLNDNETNTNILVNESISDYFLTKDWKELDIFWIDDLYENSESFRKFTTWIYATELDWNKIKYWDWSFKDTLDELDNLLTKIVSDVKLNISRDQKTIDISEDLLENLKNNKRKIIQSFKNIMNKSTYDIKNISWEKYYKQFSWNKYKFYENPNSDKNPTVNDFIEWWKFNKIIQIDNMINAKMDTVFFTAWDIWHFWYTYRSGLLTKTSNINSKINSYKTKKIYEALNEKDSDKAVKIWEQIIELESPIEWTKIFYRAFNNASTEQDIELFWWKSKLMSFMSQTLDHSWLKDLKDKWYIFAWNFWDKDSVFHFYKASEELTSKIKKEDKNKFQEYLYEYEYAFSNWFILKDSKINTFKEFKTKLEKYLEVLSQWKELSFDYFRKSFEQNKDLFKDWKSRVIDKTKNIKKREAATMSNYSTFDWVDLPINTYILEEDYNIPYQFQKYFKARTRDNIKKEIEEWGLDQVEDFLNNNFTWLEWKAISMFREYYSETKDIKKLKDALINSFINDMEDGTSYVTSDLAILRWRIQWVWSEKQIKEMMELWDYKEFKDHFFGESKDSNNSRVLWKCLFNILSNKDITSTTIQDLSNSVFIWKSSLKLEWWFESLEWKTVWINWKERKVIWKIKWTTTQYFRNASSDLFEESEDQTVSDSIKSTISYLRANEITEYQKIKIQESFNRLLKNITEPVISWDLFSEIDKRIAWLLQYGSIWQWSSSVLNNKLNDFLTETSRIVNKPKDIWQSMFIYKSDSSLSPNEMAVSYKSELFQQTLNDYIMSKWDDIIKEKWDTIKNMSHKTNRDKLLKQKAIKTFIDTNKDFTKELYSVWYRYPVPSKYNLWLYKLVIAEDIWYKNMSTKSVISNPISTYLKLEWDNDWDHIFFVSAFKNNWTDTSMWEILARELLSDSSIETKNFIEALPDIDKFNNKFIVADQVEKWSDTLDKISLTESRLSSLDAKKRIWVVSATWRTIKNLSQMFDESFDWNMKLIKNTYEQKTWYIKTDRIPVSLDEIKKKITNEFWKPFFEKYSSLLQLVLDFWNSDKTRFDSKWFVDLIWDLLRFKKENWVYNNTDLNEIYKFMYEYISPLSVSYKAWDDLKTFKVKWLWIEINKPNKELNFDEYFSKQYLYNLSWTKRQVMESFYKKYWEIVWILNDTNNISWINNNIFKANWGETEFKKLLNKNIKSFQTKELKQTNQKWRIDELNNLNNFNIDYFNKRQRSDLKKVFDSLLTDEHKSKIIKWEFTFWKYINSLFQIESLSKKEQSKLRKKLYSEEMIDTLSNLVNTKEWRFYYEASIMAWIVAWEYKIVNLLTNKQKLDYLVFTNKELNRKIEKINKLLDSDQKIWAIIKEPKLVSKEQYQQDFSKLYWSKLSVSDQNELQIDFDWLEKELQETRIKLQAIEEKGLTEEEYAIKKDLDNINIMPETWEKITYYLPEIKTDLVNSDRDSMYKVLGWIENAIYANNRAITLRISSKINKYAQWLLIPFNTITDFLNQWNSIRIANEEHIRHFSESWLLKDKKWIAASLKKYWVSDIKKTGDKIQYDLLWYTQWQFFAKDITEDLILSLAKNFEDIPESKVNELLSDQIFRSALQDYSEKVIQPVANKLTWLQHMWYDIRGSYKNWMEYTLILDTLEAHKSNTQLALKLSWVNTKDDFRKRLLESWTPERERDLLAWVLYNEWQWALEKVVWFLKSVHYQMTYWVWSIFTGNWLRAALAQLYPNTLELKAYFRNNYDEIKPAIRIMMDYGILWAESTKEFQQWLWKELNDWSLVNSLWSKIDQVLDNNNSPFRRDASKMLNMILTNPLWAWDYPLENLRKIVSVAKVLNDWWIKSVDDFNSKAMLHWDDFVWTIRHLAREQFAESGGWVVSGSSIYRDTIFSKAYYYYDNFVTRFFVQTMWYLMGWTFHKSAVALERELNMPLYAIWALKSWNYKLFKAHFSDWLAFNSILAKNLMYTAGLYLKLEKYEDNPNEHVSIEDFQKSFNNQIVSLEIALEKHITNWNMADELWWDYWDKLWFTTYWVIQHMFRLFKQPAFISTMYDHHKMKTALWEDITWQESFKFALDQQYTWYMRFNWLREATDLYNSNTYNSTVNVMWVWWKDSENELFSKMITWKMYSNFKDEWFVGSLIKLFHNVSSFRDPDQWWFAITTELTKIFNKKIMEDPELSKLVKGGQIWTWVNDYNLAQLLWNNWDKLTEQTADDIHKLFLKITNYWFNKMWVAWDKVESKYDTKEIEIYKSRIDKALKEYNMSFESLMWLAKTNPEWLTKALALLEAKHDIPNIIPLSLFLVQEKENMTKDFKERVWTIWDKWYKEIWTYQWNELEREVLLKYQNLLNLNWDVVFDVIEKHIVNKNWDLLNKMQDQFENAKFSKYDVLWLVNRSYLIWANIKEDTNVTRLHSRYALAFKWIWEWETAVRLANHFLKGVYENPNLSWKAKHANWAAILMWMSKSNYDLLKNNEEFNKLSEESKKLMVNRMYKVSKDWVDFDSSTYLNSLNQGSYWTGTTWKVRFSYPKFQSKAFEWARPNFSKQSQPLRDWLWNKWQYINWNPSGYLNKFNKQVPQYWSFPINNAYFPIMKEFNKLLIQQTFHWFKSKWVIKDYINKEKVDYKEKTYIKIAKAKVSKQTGNKQFKAVKKVKKHTRGLNPNLPLSMSWWD